MALPLPSTLPAAIARAEAVRTDDTEADLWIERWIHKFSAIPDRAIRRNVLFELVEGTDDGTLIGMLPRLDVRADGGERQARWLRTELALTPSVFLELPYGRIAELYAIAHAAGLPRQAARFLTDRPVPGKPARTENPHMDLAAGVRTAKARGDDRMTLDRLMHDRDPRIIKVLLDNPRVVERDIVRVAAMRPTLPEILEMIASHPRWSPQYRVRKALAFNPYTPTSLARQLLPTLLRQDLEELQGSKILPAELQDELRSLVSDTR
ncbi:MAG: hypothetical protein EXR69_02705 [Myxococcales bacterium]|nr:hypothetical protein [Myxococcales bacterium]